MNPKNLEVGNVLFNPKTKKYIQIKEITRCSQGSAQYFVCSDDCDFFSDSQTTIKRQVIYWIGLGHYFYLDPISASQREVEE